MGLKASISCVVVPIKPPLQWHPRQEDRNTILPSYYPPEDRGTWLFLYEFHGQSNMNIFHFILVWFLLMNFFILCKYNFQIVESIQIWHTKLPNSISSYNFYWNRAQCSPPFTLQTLATDHRIWDILCFTYGCQR